LSIQPWKYTTLDAERKLELFMLMDRIKQSPENDNMKGHKSQTEQHPAAATNASS
jgi:hypothetical protein